MSIQEKFQDRLKAMTRTEKESFLEEIEEKELRDTETAREKYIPNAKSEEYIKMIGQGDVFINLFSAANGVGKCIKLDSPILMANGKFKELGNIKHGDVVLGHNYNNGLAEPSKVIQTSRAGLKKIYRFIFKDGGYVEASPEHSFPVKVRSGRDSKIIKKKVSELLEHKANYIGGSLKFQSPKKVEFSKGSKLPIHPYLLGTLLGDGTLRDDGIMFTSKDREIIERVGKLLKKIDCKLNKYNEIDYRIVQNKRDRRGFPVNYLLNELKKLDLIKKSGEKFIPEMYKIASVSDRKLLIAGLIDTDGTFKEYVSKSERLADDFCFIVKSLGGRAIKKEKIVNNNFTHNLDSTFYRVYWRFDYKLPLSLDRKQIISARPVEYSNRIVKEIQYMGEFECGDIFIEHKDHCYISHDFISTGNTCVGANIISSICFGPAIYDGTGWKEHEAEFGKAPDSFFKYPLYENFPYAKKGRIISDPTTIKEMIVPELKKWFPSNRYKVHYDTSKEGKKYESKWITDTGFEFDLMTTEQAAKEFESVTLGWVWMDEPVPQDIYIATIARGRLGMIVMMTLTPLFHAAWIKDEIYNKRDGIFADYVTASVWDNCRQRAMTRGILEEKNIDRMISQYPEDEMKARVEGEYGHLLGRVHKLFDRKIHVISPFSIDFENYVVTKATDTHPRVDDHTLWMATNSKGTKIICNELEFGGTIPDQAIAIKHIEKVNNYRLLGEDVIDPSAYNDDKRNPNNKPISEQFEDEGINYERGSKDLTGGIRRTDEALQYTEQNGTMIMEPEIYIFDICDVCISQLDKYVWDNHKGKTADGKQKKASPKDKDDHHVENLHRLLMVEPQFKQYVNKNFQTRQLKKKEKGRSSFKPVNY